MSCLRRLDTIAPSISALDSCYEKWGRFETLKKMGYPVFCQKAGCKKPGHCYSKRKRQPGLFSFWITMTLIFAPCFLAKNRVPDFLKVQDPKKISGRPDKFDIRVQIDWVNVFLEILYVFTLFAGFKISHDSLLAWWIRTAITNMATFDRTGFEKL